MRVIKLAQYSSTWPQAFDEEASRITAVLHDTIVSVHHIGSTAVPGLAAKPVIDILMEVASLDILDEKSAALSGLGYRPRGENGIAGRRYFTKGERERTHHLHAFVAGHEQVLSHLAFRDYLRRRMEVQVAYAAVKCEAEKDSRGDPAAYALLKESFIQHHLARALGAYRC